MDDRSGFGNLQLDNSTAINYQLILENDSLRYIYWVIGVLNNKLEYPLFFGNDCSNKFYFA